MTTDTMWRAECLIMDAAGMCRRVYATDTDDARALALYRIGGELAGMAADMRALRIAGESADQKGAGHA